MTGVFAVSRWRRLLAFATAGALGAGLLGAAPALAATSSLAYTGATAGTNGQGLSLSATLTGPSPANGRTVVFTVGTGAGAQAVSATTDADGDATATLLSLLQPAGTTVVVASFEGASGYSSSVAFASLEVTDPTALTYTGDTDGVNGAGATLSATLTSLYRPDGVSGETVTFEVGSGAGLQTTTAVTDADGIATASLSLDQPVGEVDVVADYAGGSGFGAADDAATLAVVDPGALVYDGDIAGTNGTDLEFSATLMNDRTDAPVAGASVQFTIGSGPSAQSATATTDASGVAATTISLNQPAGNRGVQAAFAATSTLAGATDGDTVAVTDPTTLVYGGATAGVSGTSLALSATLTSVNQPGGVSGRTVTFTVGTGGAAQTATGTTNGSGVATATLGSLAQAAGDTTVAAEHGAADGFGASSDSETLAVETGTALAFLPGSATTGTNGEDVTISAALTTIFPTPPAAVAGEEVTFTIGTGPSAQQASATTDANGVASVTIALDQPAGSRGVTAAFAGTTELAAAAGSDAVAVTDPTTLVYGGATSGANGASVSVSATLTSVHFPAGVAGKTVSFTIGSQSASATTNASGVASASVTLDQDGAASTVQAAFAGGGGYPAASDSQSFTIVRSTATLTVTGARSARLGSQATLAATLVNGSAGDAPLAGKTLAFSVGGQNVTAVTNASGVAAVTIFVSQVVGTKPLAVTFAGDGGVAPASASVSFEVYASSTFLSLSASSGRYRGGIVLSALLKYQKLLRRLPLPGVEIRFYRVPDAETTDSGLWTYIGSATSGSDGAASFLYDMNALGSPPAAGERVTFRATYSDGGTFGSAVSSAAGASVLKRSTVLGGTVSRSGSTATLAIVLTAQRLEFRTRSAGVLTTTVSEFGIAGATLGFEWRSASGARLGSFTATTDGLGAVTGTRTVPSGASTLRVTYAGSAGFGVAPRYDLTL